MELWIVTLAGAEKGHCLCGGYFIDVPFYDESFFWEAEIVMKEISYCISCTSFIFPSISGFFVFPYIQLCIIDLSVENLEEAQLKRSLFS